MEAGGHVGDMVIQDGGHKMEAGDHVGDIVIQDGGHKMGAGGQANLPGVPQTYLGEYRVTHVSF